MNTSLYRQLGLDTDGERESTSPNVAPGKTTLTSRLAGPAMVFRVADPETARALGAAMTGPHLQRDAASGAGSRDNNGVADGAESAVAQAAHSSGEPLRADLRERFETSLGADLSAVRVHTGAASATANQAVGARAYTVGNDIHFSEGSYQPDDPFGMHLLAHEVAHTVQQGGAAPHRQHKLAVSTPSDALEIEADRAADAMTAGQPAVVSTGGAGVQRQKPKDKKDDKGKSEFKPKLVAGSGAQIAAMYNTTVSVEGKVANAGDAPAGVTWSWRWPTVGANVKPGKSGGAGTSANLELKTVKDGSATSKFQVSANNVSEFDDLPATAISDPVVVEVDKPTVTWSTEVTGKGTGPTDLRQGDKIAIKGQIANVDKFDELKAKAASARLGATSKGMSSANLPPAATSAGVSFDDGESMTMEKKDGKGDEMVYEVTVNRAGTGTVNATTKLDNVAIPDHTVELTAKATATQFRDRCGVAHSRLTTLQAVLNAYWADVLGKFNAAQAKMTSVLGARAAQQKLEDEIKIGLLLAGVGGFAGGAAGVATAGALQGVAKSVVGGGLVDVAKDMVKYTARLPAQFAPTGGPAAAAKSAAPTTLDAFLQLSKEINAHVAAASSELGKWQGAAGKAIDAASDVPFDFDPVDAVNESFRFKGQRIDALPASIAQVQWEKMFWESWLSEYGYKLGFSLLGNARSEKDTGGHVDKELQRIKDELVKQGLVKPDEKQTWDDDASQPSKQKTEKEASETPNQIIDVPI